MTITLAVLQYDSLYAPESFWHDYDALPTPVQVEANWIITLDSLFGCWTPPPRVELPIVSPPEVGPPSIEIPIPPIIIPHPPAIPEPSTLILLTLGLLAILTWTRLTPVRIRP